MDDDPSWIEFRPDYKGCFDEIVARFADGLVHVETMHGKACYVGFYWDDGRTCQWWISSEKKLHYHHEVTEPAQNPAHMHRAAASKTGEKG